MLTCRRRGDSGAMNELLAERIAWRRKGVEHHYVGALTARGDGIVLTGREPATGIEVVLTIPFSEVEDVHLSSGEQESLVGESAVVVELAESAPILVREIGLGRLLPRALALRLGELVTAARPHPLAATA
jgi:hypothetical protein